FMLFTCEFNGKLMKIDVKEGKVLDELTLSRQGSMPQDVRLTPDGTLFMVTDMVSDGVYFIDASTFKEVGFIHTGIGAHGLTTSRDGKKMFVSNRGSNRMPDREGKPGSVSVVDLASRQVERTWLIPGGGSPDMGNVTADGKELWLSGRFDGQVYAIDTDSGAVTKINVGIEPHGLTVWPQPGRFSLGHTGNMR
ncbi:MAG: YncE family protein, partial [Pseudomonadota bacterium]|nr:YncE family protein [Pseudomonadota bacterium]